MQGFIRRWGAGGVLLYLENAELPSAALVRTLHRLRWAGWLDGLAGLLIGRSAAPEPAAGRPSCPTSTRCATRSARRRVRYWSMSTSSTGRRSSCCVLINGAKATVHLSEAAGGSIEQHLD